MVDSNIIISALLWPSSKPAHILLHIARHHEIYLCDQILFEIRDVINRKAPSAISHVNQFIKELVFVKVSAKDSKTSPINDPKDQPILSAAINAHVDIIITGDKHFLNLTIEKPLIMTASQYIDYFQVQVSDYNSNSS